MAKTYFVYILFNKNRRLYVGVTSDLEGRLFQHKNHLIEGFTKRYGIDRLAYYEMGCDVREAIEREKKIKAWRRENKIALIEKANPEWRDLSAQWVC
jgi:putative endonuclease